ncbi:MAG: hypothetical protein AAFR81_01700 [Chloroflexota bacterium]
MRICITLLVTIHILSLFTVNFKSNAQNTQEEVPTIITVEGNRNRFEILLMPDTVNSDVVGQIDPGQWTIDYGGGDISLEALGLDGVISLPTCISFVFEDADTEDSWGLCDQVGDEDTNRLDQTIPFWRDNSITFKVDGEYIGSCNVSVDQTCPMDFNPHQAQVSVLWSKDALALHFTLAQGRTVPINDWIILSEAFDDVDPSYGQLTNWNFDIDLNNIQNNTCLIWIREAVESTFNLYNEFGLSEQEDCVHQSRVTMPQNREFWSIHTAANTYRTQNLFFYRSDLTIPGSEQHLSNCGAGFGNNRFCNFAFSGN